MINGRSVSNRDSIYEAILSYISLPTFSDLTQSIQARCFFISGSCMYREHKFKSYKLKI